MLFGAIKISLKLNTIIIIELWTVHGIKLCIHSEITLKNNEKKLCFTNYYINWSAWKAFFISFQHPLWELISACINILIPFWALAMAPYGRLIDIFFLDHLRIFYSDIDKTSMISKHYDNINYYSNTKHNTCTFCRER